LNVIFLLNVKLNIIEIKIPPILDKTNKEDVMKNRLKNAISINVAIPPVVQNNIIFWRVLFFAIFIIVIYSLQVFINDASIYFYEELG